MMQLLFLPPLMHRAQAEAWRFTNTDSSAKQHGIQWRVLLLSCALLSFAKVVVGDVFGAAISGSLACFLWHIVYEETPELTLYVVTAFGLACAVSLIFDLSTLILCLRGRRIDRTGTFFVDSSGKHPFFDPQQGWNYNLQSAMMIFTPVILLWGALLSCKVNSSSSPDLWDTEPQETLPIIPRHDWSYGVRDVTGAPPDHGKMNLMPPGMQAFSGQGMRLDHHSSLREV